MSARQMIAATRIFLFLATLCALAPDTASAAERWPPWQSYTEAVEAAHQKAQQAQKRRAAASQNTLTSLNARIEQLKSAKKYSQAVPLARRALVLTRQKHANGIETAAALETLAGLYEALNKPAQAAPLLKQALDIRQQAPGQPDVAATRERLAVVYDQQGKSAEAQRVRGDAVAEPPPEARPAPDVAKEPAATDQETAAKVDDEAGAEAAAAARKAEEDAARARAAELIRRQMAQRYEPSPSVRGRVGSGASPAPSFSGRQGIEPKRQYARPPAPPPAPVVPPPPAPPVDIVSPPPPSGGSSRDSSEQDFSVLDELDRDPPSAGAFPPPAAAPAPPPPAAGAPDDPAGGSGPPPTAAPASVPDPDWQIVPVYWGTDRAVQPNAERLAFGSDRARRLETGLAEVTVPKVHEVPNVERPWVVKIPYFDVTLYAEKEDPKKHFTLKSIKAMTREELLAQIKARLAASKDYKDQALVFVHGYNTSFDNALYRTAQIAYDLDFDGAPFLYSWPSGGAVASYTYDRESAQASVPYLREFLDMVVKETGAKQVSVIAHSMGNQPVMDVLREMRNATPEGVVISQVILAAPDVDADTFSNLARSINGLAKNVTLYVAANDRALTVSRNFWGSYRAGDVPPQGPLILPGIDTIDVTAASTDTFAINHSGYASNNRLLDDIGELLRTGLRPPEMRPLKFGKITTNAGDYWRYVPAP